eukprot:TRINITY_DN34865_c0_g1_i1.p1 TRINITY_DN34865_c0_g1~~TRINITY_DN34865_c0_g1_i1.p1  ORF type:complete len:615 (-),score=60.52 TRINITY_DN34865_c0_g1_i1:18-1862(-)
MSHGFTALICLSLLGTFCAVFLLVAIAGDSQAALTRDEGDAREPNPPVWPDSVQVFDPSMSDIGDNVSQLYAQMYEGKFEQRRAALLFKPGNYDVDIPVGYYTQVIGLGSSVHDVTFSGQRGVYSAGETSGDNFNTFWRGAENIAVRPSSRRMIWSVSQASALRRLHVEGDLALGATSTSKGSGGYISGINVTGQFDLTSQQQWLVRNCKTGSVTYNRNPIRAVNFVYVGTEGAPESTENCTDSSSRPQDPSPQVLAVDKAPVVIEKPFIVFDDGKYSLITPKAGKDARGLQWAASSYKDSFENVFVATETTSVGVINEKLAKGRHVILTPGVYRLPEPIVLGTNPKQPYQVLLGLGLATLIPTNGTAAIEVGDAGGVRVAGVLLQAGQVKSESLLRWGKTDVGDRRSSSETEPGLLADIYARVGGEEEPWVGTTSMIEVNGDNVVLDNVWLWRADCCVNGCGTCKPRLAQHGLVVNGNGVVAYGLAAEHTQSDPVVWNGEGGQVFFYQSELDSFAHQPEDNTTDYGPNGVSGYKVNANTHTAFGVGVYDYFILPGIKVNAGVVVRNEEVLKTIRCPFKWDINPAWYGSWRSTIEQSIALVPTDAPAMARLLQV